MLGYPLVDQERAGCAAGTRCGGAAGVSRRHLKLSRTEKELYEEFLKTEEAEILAEMQQHFAEAKQKAGGIRFDDQSLWSRIKSTVDAWIANACVDKHVHRELVRRAKEAILHRVRNLMAKTIRESLGAMRLPEGVGEGPAAVV